MKITVIGGGASGIMAAITAKRAGADVTILERMDKIGKKILATGNGRCNYTNINTDISKYHGQNPKFALYALETFNINKTIEFFKELGMLTKITENGKAFPYSMQASCVLDILRFQLDKLKITVKTGFDVQKAEKIGDKFAITAYDGEKIICDKVILACGGKASSFLGSNGSGYDIAKGFGHTVTKLFESLVQVKTEEKYPKAMKGIKTDCTVKYVKDKTLVKSKGEILFTDYGVSGPCIFNISRYCNAYKNGVLKIDLLPEIEFEELRIMLNSRKRAECNLENYLVGLMNKKIGMTVIKYAGLLPYSRSSSELSQKEINTLCEAIKSFELKVSGTESWNNAQVTAGGILCEEVCEKTMESKKCKGLYFAGEILDIDGDCGGYNLQWAWSSGYIAGKNSVN